MVVFSYPGPCAPEYTKPTSVEECLPTARKLVSQEYGRAALGPVQAGEYILIVTLPDQDEYIQTAVTTAFEEAGAAHVDFVSVDEITGTTLATYSAADGWREAEMLVEGKASTSMSNADLATGILTDDLLDYVETNPEYTSIFTDIGSRSQKRASLGERFKGNWLFNNWEEFISNIWVFPDDLQKDIEHTAVNTVGDASHVRITDPEGTHLEYSISEEEAKRWHRGAMYPGHLYCDHFGITVNDPNGPLFPQVSGTLAGTSNHTGFFPRIELSFENGKLVDVSGGGDYGARISDLAAKYRDIQWPGYPDTGLFWFVEAALCTLPKAFRRTSDLFESYLQYPNIIERNRNGVFHFGFGSANRANPTKVEEYAIEHNIPTGHVHVHNYFVTYEIKLRSTGNWHKIVDKGRITAMDDPAVRAHASMFGDPDELLSYDWIPPLPGINCEGSYLDDYAPNPIAYLTKRIDRDEPI